MMRRLSQFILALSALCSLTASGWAALLIDPTDGVILWRDNNDYDDEVIRSRPLGFDFSFFGGDPVTTIDVCTNGNLNFDGNTDYVNETTPGEFARISPLWDDLEIVKDSGDSVIEKVAPGLYYSVTWKAHERRNSATRHIFQVVIFGSAVRINGIDFVAGDIVFAYAEIGSSFAKGKATVALDAGGGGSLIPLIGSLAGTGVVVHGEAGLLPLGAGGYVLFRDDGSGEYINTVHINHPPLAADDTLYTSSKKRLELDVLANDLDADGGPFIITSATQGAFGNVSIVGGNRLAYQPATSFAGTDIFTYTMRDPHGLTSTARVTLLPFAAGKGVLDGLVNDAPAEDDEASAPELTNEGSGYLKVTLAAGGTFSGSLRYGGLSFTLKGAFDMAGNYSTLLQGKVDGVPHSWTLRLHLDLAAEGNQLTGTIDDGEVSSVVSAGRTRFVAATLPAGQEGKYTVLLKPGESGDGPTGIGYAMLSVTKAGVAKFVGKLPDGSTLSYSSTVKPDGTLPVYVPYALRKNQRAGSLFGLVQFDDLPDSDCAATMRWFKPDTDEVTGFAADPVLEGSRYKAPKKNERLLTLADTVRNGFVNVADSITHDITLTTANRVLVEDPSDEKLALTLNASTGALTGSFREPHPEKENVWIKRSIYGAVLQKQKKAGGYFLSPEGGGSVVITPPEE